MAHTIYMNDGTSEILFGGTETTVSNEFRKILETRLGRDAAAMFDRLCSHDDRPFCDDNTSCDDNDIEDELLDVKEELKNTRAELEDARNENRRLSAENDRLLDCIHDAMSAMTDIEKAMSILKQE